MSDIKPKHQHRFHVASIYLGESLGTRFFLCSESGALWLRGTWLGSSYLYKDAPEAYCISEAEALKNIPSPDQYEILPSDTPIWRVRAYTDRGMWDAQFHMLDKPDMNQSMITFHTLDQRDIRLNSAKYNRVEVECV